MSSQNGRQLIPSVLAIASCSVLGVLTRAFFNLLFSADGANLTSPTSPLFLDLPANILGCFILGALNALKSSFSIPPLLILSLSTGYAGSVTTFASWNLQVIVMWAQGLVLSSPITLLFGVWLPYCAQTVGHDFGDAVAFIYRKRYPPTSEPPQQPQPNTSPSEPSPDPRYWSLTLTLLISFLLIISSTIILAIFDTSETRRVYWMGASFAPLGALLRWRLSVFNSGHSFPFGTFIANFFATIFNATLGAVMITTQISAPWNQLISASSTGFAGSLSTVSTWLSEASDMTTSHRYFYILTTIASSQAAGVLIFGIPYWII